jgi:hypothetical protein
MHRSKGHARLHDLLNHLVGGSGQFAWHGEPGHPSAQAFFLAQGRLEALLGLLHRQVSQRIPN